MLAVAVMSFAAAVQASEEKDVARSNRLAQESSPYLLLHAHNPVDWYPWGPEALEKARTENKPIFLSVGYSSCYWCHVMEREVFSNEKVAQYMNAHFVNIKVDREERPDIDDIYMTSLIVYQQAAGQRGGGGWPLSMFLTPGGDPIAGATYLPPEDTDDGRTGFLTVAGRVHELWSTREKDLAASASVIAAEVRRLSGPQVIPSEPVTLDGSLIDGTVNAIRDMYDPVWGGVDFRRNRPDGPRFPNVPRLSLLLSVAATSDDADLLRIVEHTLQSMAQGGIRDHLAGGFHRYSTDRRWHVPHFEKMLYDQAMLLKIYSDAAAITGKAQYADVAASIVTFVRNEMTLPDGGFCSALDAETNAIEGEYYVWQPEEVEAAMGADDAALFFEVYGMNVPTPFEHGYVLHLPQPVKEVAEEHEMTEEQLQGQLGDMRARLLQVRSQRERPLLDDKVLTEWNALMIHALAVSGTLPGHESDLELARNAANFLLTTLKDEQGQLQRSWRNGQTSGAAYLDDYAYLVAALIQLHQATSEPKWLDAARSLMATQMTLFHDDQLATFYFSAHDHEMLIARTSTVFDSVTESGNSVAVRNLLALSDQTDTLHYRDAAEAILRRYGHSLKTSPAACSGLAAALHTWLQDQPQALHRATSGETILTSAGSLPISAQEQQNESDNKRVAKSDDDEPATNTVFKPVFPDPAQSTAFSKRDEERPVKARIYPMFDKLERGGRCPVAIELTIRDKWHINANPSNPDFLVPTAVKITCEQKVKMTKVKYPKHELMFPTGSRMPYHVYGEKVIIYGLLEIDALEKSDKADVRIEIQYQACNEKECLPPDSIVMKGKLTLANPGDDIKRINEDKFPKPKKKPEDEPEK